MTNPVASPCISVCLLDEKDMCVGCYRTAAEITEWMLCDDDGRREILKHCAERMKLEQKQIFK
jgi:predicted Fe-S protein YdhL (DUF1289 family)